MPRTPKRPPRPSEAEERRAALLALDVAAMRAWAARWLADGDNTIALADDASLLISMHEARLRDETMPADERYVSALVLAARGDATAQAALDAVRGVVAQSGRGDAT